MRVTLEPIGEYAKISSNLDMIGLLSTYEKKLSRIQVNN